MLVIAAMLNFIAAALHVFVILGGPKYYRLFGAGERLAQMAEEKKAWPAVLTSCIALILASWGVIALSLNGIIMPIPYALEVFWAIAIAYSVRAVYPFILSPWVAFFRTRFMVVSSLIVGGFAVIHIMAIVSI